MPSPYKVNITGAGVSTDIFSILYTLTGDTNVYPASDSYGILANNLTFNQLKTGFTVLLPTGANAVYVMNIGGLCNGRTVSISI